MPDFSFVGASYVAASITQEDQECINWYPEIDQTGAAPTGRGVIALYPTPGLLLQVQPEISEVRGLHVLPGGQTMLAVIGMNLYSVDTSYNCTIKGALKTSTGIVSITDNGVGAYITDGLYRYSYIWGTSTFANVTDGAFNGADVCNEVDNFIIYNNPDTNQWGCTDVGAVTSGALNFGSKIGYSDNIVSIIPDHRQVLILGEVYSEKWINVGAFPFPFAIIPGSSIQHGLAAKNSVARLGEGIAYLAMDSRGNATVVQWGANVAPARISTFAIENAIQGYAVISDAIGYTYSQSGHEFYMLTFPTADVTWCYDLSTQLWHKRAWRDPVNGVYRRHRGNCATLFNGDVVVGDFENGKLYTFSQTTYTDDGDAIPCVRRAPHMTADLKRQFFHDIQIQFQPGVGLQAGQGSDPQCILRWSNNGGFTFGNDHLLNIGKAGKYKNRAIKRRLGWARDRVYEVVVTDPVYRVIVSANLNASAGVS